MDKLARNAFLSGHLAMYGRSTGIDFGDITTSDTITTSLLNDITLGMAERDVPGFVNDSGAPGNIFCITTPGVLRDIRHEASNSANANAFIDVMKYADPKRIVAGEVGSYQGIRFIATNDACLFNNGTIIAQTTVTSAVAAGDGAPNPGTTAVYGVEYVGQPGKTHHITVADASGFAVGDKVALHTDRTNDFGVTNGVDFRDGTLQAEMEIVAINGNNISFRRPSMWAYTTDLGGGVYAYLTKASNVHTALFVADTDGVVMGVAQPPRLHNPAPIDDLDQIFRFTYDMYLGYQVFNPYAFETLYLAGSNRHKGARYIR